MAVRFEECEKIQEAQEKHSQEIGTFLTWLSEHGYWICEVTPKECDTCDCDECNVPDLWYPTTKRTEQLLAEYFGIDLEEAEEERRFLLDALRGKQK